ncbi:hypothetical protein M514_06367 [Trichuris suis]|uniref:Major facilitator superfamily (MFS) profile domain-containing protein n=1 Tax=Trichuris suis TaxID=68888 RepID=A0A085NPV3_9BILA|nr:hypothetical protein M514_06367 [Trichuris suis]
MSCTLRFQLYDSGTLIGKFGYYLISLYLHLSFRPAANLRLTLSKLQRLPEAGLLLLRDNFLLTLCLERVINKQRYSVLPKEQTPCEQLPPCLSKIFLHCASLGLFVILLYAIFSIIFLLRFRCEMPVPKTPVPFDERAEKVKFEETDKPDESPIRDSDGPIPPDGGYGWVIVFASFMANTVVDGIAYSFGIMLPELHSYFKGSVQTVAWVGSVLVGVYSLTGPVASGMINKFGARSVCIAGATIGMLGFVSSTWATSLPFLMLTYGVLGGIGLGFIYIPACVYVSYYFEKKRSLATGIAVAGSGFGTFVFAPLTTALLEHYGWKGTLWILSGMVANCGVFGALLWPLRQSKASATSQERRSTLIDIPELSVAEEALLAQENENTALVKPVENTRPNVTAMNHEAVKSTEPTGRRRSHKYSLDNLFYPNRDAKMQHKSLSHLHISRQRSTGLAKQRTHSLHSLYFATANPADLYKPFSRKDIFYPGSVHKLQEITSQSNAYFPSERKLTADHSDVDEFVEQLIAEGQPTKSRRCPCLPRSFSKVLLNMVNYRLLSHPSMLILCVANIVGMLGFYVPFVYLTAYAESLGSTKEQSSLLLSVIGITNTIGRVLFGWISDQRWVTALTINNVSLLFCGALTSLCMVFGLFVILLYAIFSIIFLLRFRCEMPVPKTPVPFDERAEKVKFEETDKPDESPIRDSDGPIPPDGGYGWVIVFASFMANTVVDGIAYSFGIMLPELHSYFKGSVQTVAWVGSVLVGVYSLTGPVASGMINKFGARSVCIAGATIGMLGFVSSTWATSLPFLMLTYGVLGGIGLGFIYIPACVYVSYYFEKKRSLATGIAVAGSGFGTFVFAPLTTALLEHYGWKGTLWILSGMVANCGVFGALLWPLRQSKASATSQERRSTLIDIPELSVAEEALLAQENENTALVKPVENTRPNVTAMNHEAVKSTEPTGRRRSHKYSLDNLFYPNRDAKMQHKSLSHLHISRQRSTGLAKQRTHSLHSLYFATANPADLYKPFSRKDIFYPGSVHKLQEITSQSNAYFPSERKLTADHSDVDEFVEQLIAEGQPTKSRRCPCLPRSFSKVLLNMVNYRLLSHPSMLILCVANIVGMLGFYVPFVYLTAYAESLGSTKEQSSLLLSVIGITNTIGRVLFGWISDQRWVTALTINNVSLLFCGALTSLCMVFGTYTLLMTYSVLFGLFIAPYISLTAVILVEEVGLEQLTNAFGLLVLARGVSAMVGSPIGGAVYDSTGAYKFSFLVAGALIFISGLIHYLIPLYHWLQGKGIVKDSRQE